MEIITKVPICVMNEVQQNGVCYAKNQTSYSEYAYGFLKDITGYKGLFFGVLHNDYIKRTEQVEEITSLSSSENEVMLTLDIPQSECYPHDYYSFSDMIYYHDEQEMSTVEIIKGELRKPQLDNIVQCVFDRIEEQWIVKERVF